MGKNKLGVIVPCFNEEESLKVNIELLRQRLFLLMEKELISEDSFICFIDDGSKDKTWQLIVNAHQNDSRHIKALKFTKR